MSMQAVRPLRAVAQMILALALMLVPALKAQAASAPGDGVVSVASGYTFAETIDRLKKDIAGKGIVLFAEIDQAKLASNAKIELRPSTLLVFGNPALGTQFLTSNPYSGLDWPVRLLVSQDSAGRVWASYSDFDWIARRHHITDRAAAFKMASEVIGSITSSIASH